MTTTFDRRAADHLRADAYILEAVAAELHAKAAHIEGNINRRAGWEITAQNFRAKSASARQDAEQVPHHSEEN